MKPSIALLLIMSGSIWAQSVPGQLATAPDLRAVSSESLAAPVATEPSVAAPNHNRLLTGIWIGSMAAMLGATALDAGTSWGKREANGFLASSDGTFGAKGLAIKASLAAGILVPEILFRRHKSAKIAAILANSSQAAVFSAVSVHNLGVVAPK